LVHQSEHQCALDLAETFLKLVQLFELGVKAKFGPEVFLLGEWVRNIIPELGDNVF